MPSPLAPTPAPSRPATPRPWSPVVRAFGGFASNGLQVPGGPSLAQNAGRGIDEPPNPTPMPASMAQLFVTPANGSVALPPRDAGDQGISTAEAPVADRAIAALLTAPGTALVATVRDGA